MTGFKGRSGRTFRAKLKIVPADEGKWRVDFDEEWASNGATAEPKHPRRPPEAEAEARSKRRRGRSLAASVLDEHSRGGLAHQLLDLLSRRRGHGG